MITNHKYLDNIDIIYEDDEVRIFYITNTSKYYRSKIKFYNERSGENYHFLCVNLKFNDHIINYGNVDLSNVRNFVTLSFFDKFSNKLFGTSDNISNGDPILKFTNRFENYILGYSNDSDIISRVGIINLFPSLLRNIFPLETTLRIFDISSVKIPDWLLNEYENDEHDFIKINGINGNLLDDYYIRKIKKFKSVTLLCKDQIRTKRISSENFHFQNKIPERINFIDLSNDPNVVKNHISTLKHLGYPENRMEKHDNLLSI